MIDVERVLQIAVFLFGSSVRCHVPAGRRLRDGRRCQSRVSGDVDFDRRDSRTMGAFAATDGRGAAIDAARTDGCA